MGWIANGGVAIDRGEAWCSGEESSGSRVGMIEIVGYDDDLLARTTSPEENEENERKEDWKVVAAISKDDSDAGKEDE